MKSKRTYIDQFRDIMTCALPLRPFLRNSSLCSLLKDSHGTT